MSEQFFPFDSVRQADGKGDRVYKSQDWANYYKNFITTGLMHSNGNVGLNIDRIENLQIFISEGGAFIEGRQYLLNDEKALQFDVEANHYRRDLVVLRMDSRINERSIKLQIAKGIPSLEEAQAIAPELTRDENIYELGLYTVLIKPQAVTINKSDIVDLRGDLNYCTLSNPKGFGGATIFVGKETPNPKYVKIGDLWLPEIEVL